jgi:hypothetical protein
MKFIATRLEILVCLAFLWVAAGILWPPLSYFAKTQTLPLDASDQLAPSPMPYLPGFLRSWR